MLPLSPQNFLEMVPPSSHDVLDTFLNPTENIVLAHPNQPTKNETKSAERNNSRVKLNFMASLVPPGEWEFGHVVEVIY